MEMYSEFKYYSVLSPWVIIKDRKMSAWKKVIIFAWALWKQTHIRIWGSLQTSLRWRCLLQWPLADHWFILQFVSTCCTCLCAKLAAVLGCFWQAYIATLKKKSKSTVLSLDFTTNPLEQEHVRDRSVKCTPAVRKQLHRTTVPQNLPVLWHPIREPWINVPACMKGLWGRGVCRINIAVGLRACVQNNYMLHCCDKNGPKQLLFATNLAWEVPNSGGQKSHWILYVSKYAFPGGCWLLVA